MKTQIFRSLKSSFLQAAQLENQSLVELGITELAAGNFAKAIDLSEELIKKDINDASGWAMKALSQAYLFDYNEKQFYLNSSTTSLDEFKSKTKLHQSEVIKVESLFITTVLNRTIQLVKARVEEVIELRKRAIAEKSKANAAAVGALMSAYVGSQSKSNVGKTLGYGGAVVGAAASSSFTANADRLTSVSKGVFGVAISNMTITVEFAQTLKANLNHLDTDVREEALITLKNWIGSMAYLYREVLENLNVHIEELVKGNIFSTPHREAMTNFISAPEIRQFLFLSEIIRVEESIPEYAQMKQLIGEIQSVDSKKLNQEFRVMYIVLFSILFFGAMSFLEFSAGVASKIDLIGLLVAIYLVLFPLGSWGKLRKQMKAFAAMAKKFKVSSETLILENMKGNNYVLN